MKKLLNDYELNSDMQYYELIVDSFTNGQRTQAIEQFKRMPKVYRKAMVKCIVGGHWAIHLDKQYTLTLIDNI